MTGLVDTTARRAAADGLDITFDVEHAEALPYDDHRFDYVLSAIGTMFTANHQQTADEVVRMCPGGRIGMAIRRQLAARGPSRRRPRATNRVRW